MEQEFILARSPAAPVAPPACHLLPDLILRSVHPWSIVWVVGNIIDDSNAPRGERHSIVFPIMPGPPIIGALVTG